MLNRNYTLLTVIILIICTNRGFSQEGKTYCADTKFKIAMIKTKDGATLFGDLVTKSDSLLIVNSNSIGIINIPIDQVKDVDEIACSKIKDGKYWFENPGSQFYLFSPSVFPINKGEFYYRNSVVVFNSFGYGLTKNITLHTGFDVLSLALQGEEFSFYIMPQFTFNIKGNLNMGVGFLYANTNQSYLDRDIAAPVMNIGYGNKDRNIGMCLGYNTLKVKETENGSYFAIEQEENKRKPFYIVNGIYRISRRIAFEAEYFHSTALKGNYTIIYGAKILARKLSIDFGFINNTYIAKEIIIGIPYVSFMIKV